MIFLCGSARVGDGLGPIDKDEKCAGDCDLEGLAHVNM